MRGIVSFGSLVLDEDALTRGYLYFDGIGSVLLGEVESEAWFLLVKSSGKSGVVILVCLILIGDLYAILGRVFDGVFGVFFFDGKSREGGETRFYLLACFLIDREFGGESGSGEMPKKPSENRNEDTGNSDTYFFERHASG